MLPKPRRDGEDVRVLVTGGSGFLGSHIVDALTAAGHDVVVFDQHESPWRTDAQEFVAGDVRDLDGVKTAVEGAAAVYHLAAVADLDDALSSPRAAMDVNVMGTVNTLEAARQAGVERFLLASSIYVHSDAGSVYRTSKRAAEGIARDYHQLWGLPLTILRFGSLYGPRADPSNAVRRLLEQALEKRRIEFWGDGTEVREYIHVSDAATLAVEALGSEFVGDVLHLTGQERITTRELVEMIVEMMGGDIEVSYNDRPFTGRYRLTPYSYPGHSGDLGRRLTGRTHIDLGLGLLHSLNDLDRQLGSTLSRPADDHS